MMAPTKVVVSSRSIDIGGIAKIRQTLARAILGNDGGLYVSSQPRQCLLLRLIRCRDPLLIIKHMIRYVQKEAEFYKRAPLAPAFNRALHMKHFSVYTGLMTVLPRSAPHL